MNAIPFDLPATFARLWVDTSVQMLRATTELWGSVLAPAPATSSRPRTSTAAPWWMPPQQPTAAPLAAGMWSPFWPQAMPLPALPAPPFAGGFLPWLATPQPAPGGNPFAIWQQMWLQAASQLAPFSPVASMWPAGATPSPAWPLWQPPEPIATVYRTANGHAMAAVLRTMADVVEPKARGNAAVMDYWPYAPGTRH